MFYFLQNDIDSAFYYYQKAFDEFDFVFPKDCYKSAELAVFQRRNEDAKNFIYKGFENGIEIKHLKEYSKSGFYSNYNQKLLELYNTDSTSFLKEYKLRRPKYLKRVNQFYLSKLYELHCEDQSNKSARPGESREQRRKYYEEYNSKLTDALVVLIKKYGFPSDKTVGIDQADFFAELGKPNFDLFPTYKSQYEKDTTTYSITAGQFVLDDFCLGRYISFSLMIHDDKFYLKIKDMIPELIKKGELHPREAAQIYDNYIHNLKDHSVNDIKYNVLPPYWTGTYVSSPKSDLLRKNMNIVPLQIDSLEYRYAEKNNMRLYFGFWDCK